jgi:hypothetical protein
MASGLPANHSCFASLAGHWELEATIKSYLDQHNAQPKPFVWTKSADQILDSIARYCRRIKDSGH